MIPVVRSNEYSGSDSQKSDLVFVLLFMLDLNSLAFNKTVLFLTFRCFGECKAMIFDKVNKSSIGVCLVFAHAVCK